MPNLKLAYRHQVRAPIAIPITHTNNGVMLGATLAWTSSNIELATVDVNGVVSRVMTADTGTVIITASGYFMDPTKTVPSDQTMRPFTGSIPFDLVPLADLLPVVNINLKINTLQKDT